MSVSFDDPESPSIASPLPTDTLADSVVMLLGLTVVQRLIGFVRSVLFCGWLSAEQLGLWDMAFSFLLLAAPLAVLAIPGTFGRYLEYYRQRCQLRVFLTISAVLCTILSAVAFVGIFFARHWFSKLIFGSGDQSQLVAVAAGCLIAVIAFNFLIELLTALRNIRLVSIMQLIGSGAFALLGVGLLFGWQPTAESVLVAYGGSCLIAVLWAGYAVARTLRARKPCAEQADRPAPASRSEFFTRVVPFAGWVLLGSILINLFGVVDRYMIIHFSRIPAADALDTVGNYYSSRIVPMLLVSVATMLGGIILPHLSHDWEAGLRDRVAQRLRLFLKLCGFALFAGGVVVLLAAPILFQVILHGKFRYGESVLPWTLVYCTWFGLSMIVQTYLLCAEKASLASVAVGCGLLLSIPLNIFLLPRLGLEGAVLATASANALSLVLTCWFSRRSGFQLDDGAKLVLVLPMLICLGPWISLFALVAVMAVAFWTDRLLTTDEKHLIAERFRTMVVNRFDRKRAGST